jgi:hypothetical protein
MFKIIYTAVMAVFLWGKSCSVEVDVPVVYVWSEILLQESVRHMKTPSVNGYMISRPDDIDTITWSPELIHRLHYVGTGLIKYDQYIEEELREKYQDLYKSWNDFVQNITCNSKTYASATRLLIDCLRVVK